MPYATHVRMTMSGRFGDTSPGYEHFSFGISYAASAGLSSAQITAMTTDTTDFFSNADNLVSVHAHLESIKFATIGVDGHYVDTPVVVPVAVAGGADDVVHPPQIAWCVSIDQAPVAGVALTPAARKRGRFYLPMPVHHIDPATGELLTTTAPATCAAAVAAWIESLNTDGGGAVVVASSIDGNHPVTRVRVGRALDTIRSRRRDLDEHYAAVAIL